MRAGVVVGMRAEARIARRLGPVEIGGGTAAGAAAAAARLAPGVEALISFGLAGGIDPVLPPGAVVIAQATIRPDDPRAVRPAILDVTAPVTTAAEKRALARSGALAVDLETAAVAREAEARGMPWLAVRAICDPAWRDLPPAALRALDASGRVSPARVIGSVLRAPWQLPGLILLTVDAASARGALRDLVRRETAASLFATAKAREERRAAMFDKSPNS